ncbi:hypothetical protein SAMN05444156_2476 [Verrucomicrobium sp. GAS474]|uniref:hypothetical protein n=1 Tax=Verrucomicrobium sp. GAS474 TaxID=1882831 RepID=UPI00087B0639|nr:hypothetical protein [Verrucomicrobium sp. GAS474]SDU18555.1 hypothetical protein SAMN05444156_2476 [Verrucomicrobium sp. GAS474]
MNTNPLYKGILTENAVGIGPVTDEMVRARGEELALIANHAPTQADYDQAKRELTGGSDIDPQEAMLEAIPDPNPWDPALASTGHKTPESASEDEDEDGRSASAQLVEEGVSEAEHDQMLQAAQVAEQKDRRESDSQQ